MSSGSGRVIRVLHVDDDRDLAELTATFLEREDDRFDVEIATDADEGEERLTAGAVDCIVSDYDMPGQNGIEFLESVRTEHPDLPFILFTGKGSEEVASDAISAGVTDYLQKGSGTDRYTVLANRIVNAVEHDRSRRLVERSRKRLREIVDSLPQLLYVTDEDGTYLLANEALAEFHGTTVDDIEGRHVSEVLGDDADQFLSDLADVLESGSPSRITGIELADATGEIHRFEPRVLPYGLAETDKRAVLGVSVDVTDREERERALERKNERLAEFTKLVSQDLREPLDAVRDALGSAERSGESEHFERGHRAVDRMETMIDDLLTLSRQGETITDTVPVDLAILAADCWETAGSDEGRLVVETDLTVRADRDRLARLLENLIRNAVEHGSTSSRSGADERSVTVTIDETDDGFYVEDDGPGVPSDVREQVFESGLSTAPETMESGLAVVDRIAEAHGWAVELSECDEGGARFEVTGVEPVS
ncbi:hybrid sensor histidine kinase/response regulator [Halosimplex salinum]|uniref:hybrid sensor histidine kinase/response regulator n=1 Tax=Halosimplex salinum TaxID=1710538 RepID=UPI000F48C595|nr:response regulator [Halosimplex salinum]